jgi:hypothetical protein
VATLMEAVPPGSYLALSHVANDIVPAQAADMIRRLNRLMYEKTTPRAQAGVARFFANLSMVEPGVVRVQQWRPDTETEATTPSNMWGGLARKD